MMNLQNVDLLALQTLYMQGDSFTRGLSAALNRQLKSLYQATRRTRILTNIQDQEEAVLDELAWQYHVDEYDANYPLDTKRSLIQSAIAVHRYRGTPYACEQVTTAVFGEGSVIEEWFAYGGEPGHYRVITANPALAADNYQQFLGLIRKVGRVGAVLDGILMAFEGRLDYHVGLLLHDYAVETHEVIGGAEWQP